MKLTHLAKILVLVGSTLVVSLPISAEQSGKDSEAINPPRVGPNGKPLYYFLVFSNTTPGEEAEFERWYDRIHAPVMIESSDFVWSQRFELSPSQFGGGLSSTFPRRQNLVIFAVESDNIDEVIADADRRLHLPRNVSSTALDYSSLLGVTYMASSPLITQAEAQKRLDEEEKAGRVPAKDAKGPADRSKDLPPPPVKP